MRKCSLNRYDFLIVTDSANGHAFRLRYKQLQENYLVTRHKPLKFILYDSCELTFLKQCYVSKLFNVLEKNRCRYLVRLNRH